MTKKLKLIFIAVLTGAIIFFIVSSIMIKGEQIKITNENSFATIVNQGNIILAAPGKLIVEYNNQKYLCKGEKTMASSKCEKYFPVEK